MKFTLVGASLSLGLLLVIIYFCVGFRAKKTPALGDCLSALLTGAALTCGGLLLAAPFHDGAKKLVTDFDFYLGLAGVAVVWVSMEAYWKARPR